MIPMSKDATSSASCSRHHLLFSSQAADQSSDLFDTTFSTNRFWSRQASSKKVFFKGSKYSRFQPCPNHPTTNGSAALGRVCACCRSNRVSSTTEGIVTERELNRRTCSSNALFPVTTTS